MRKRRYLHLLLLLFTFVLPAATAFAQDGNQQDIIDKIISFPDKIFHRIDKEASKTEQRINTQTEKYLNKLQKQEEKLKRKLWKTDSSKAKEVFGDVKGRYDALRNSMKAQGDKVQAASNVYNGHIDSVGTAMKFLQNNPQLMQGTEAIQKINTNLQSVTNLQNSFNQTELIRKQIQQRQQYLKDQLQNTALLKEFKQFRKQVYYYQQQAREYKEALSDPDKLGKKLLEKAMKFPAFQNFFQQNSELAMLFPMPNGGAPVPAGMPIPGLQTRTQVMGMIQQQLGSAGPNAQQVLQQNISEAQNEISKLKNKLGSFSSGSSEEELPDFKTNDQKTKSFLKRIEFGTNMQTTKGSYYFPVTSDVGLSAGFKLNDKSIIGIGASYKIGFGQNWENIRITHQGAGVRTFIDYKIKGGFWISGGGEMNYRAEFRRIEVLKDYSAWQRSALLGISKKYNVGKKWKGNAQVLYDLLWNRQVPRTQAVVFRVGYNF